MLLRGILMSIEIAVRAEHGVVGSTEDGGPRGAAGVTEERTGVPGRHGVGGVDVAIAG